MNEIPDWKEKQWTQEKLLDLRIGPAFPVNLNESKRGMSYRMWLIGQALAGSCACENIPDSDDAARFAIDASDAVIKQLSEEK